MKTISIILLALSMTTVHAATPEVQAVGARLKVPSDAH